MASAAFSSMLASLFVAACSVPATPGSLAGSYDIVIDMRLAIEPGARGAGLVVEGRADVTPDAVRLSDLECRPATGTLEPAGLEGFCRSLAQVWGRRMSPDGRLEEVGLPRGLDLTGEGLVKHLSGVLQVSVAGGKGIEIDPMGPHDASYRWDGGELVRTTSGYRDVDIQASTRFAWRDQRLERLVHREVASSDEVAAATTQTSVTLERRSSAPDLALPMDLRWVAPDAPASADAVDAVLDRGRLGSASPETTVAQALAAVDQPGRAPMAPDVVLRTLASAYRQHPALQSTATTSCEAARPSCALATLALSAVGTDAAQASLVRALQAARSTEGPDPKTRAVARREVVRAMGTRLPQAPVPAVVDALVSCLDDPWLRPQAAYGLGTVSRRAREAGDSTTAGRALAAIDALLSEDGPRRDQLVALRALMNARAPSSRPRIAPWTQHPDRDVAEAASEALAVLTQGDRID